MRCMTRKFGQQKYKEILMHLKLIKQQFVILSRYDHMTLKNYGIPFQQWVWSPNLAN